jgi:formimidoylglutamase
VWPEVRPGRFAAAIYRNSTDLLDSPGAMREAAAKCRIGLIGLTDDTGVAMNHGRPGAREGPHAFRRALAGYGVATPMARGEAPYPRVFDAGDIIPGRDIHETHDRVTAAVDGVLDLGLMPVAIGGGHDLTFPFVRAVSRRQMAARPGAAMIGLYLDAHLDVRAEVGSGMPFRRLLEERLVAGLLCVGANPLANVREHAEWFEAHGGRIVTAAEAAAGGTPAPPPGDASFLSLDLDVLDAAFAPGVSAINPCGMTPPQVAAVVRAAGRNPRVTCFDIMELNPRHDPDGRTARLAAHMFLEFLRGLSERPGGRG